MTTGIIGQKICILRTDENCDATWRHLAGKSQEKESIGKKKVSFFQIVSNMAVTFEKYQIAPNLLSKAQ
jgi:hypothetical protein